MTTRVEVDVGGRRLSLSNLDKVLWPRPGLTKRWLVDYYAAVAPALLRHAGAQPVTLHRFPDGVEGPHFYETRAPARPGWVQTVTFRMARTGKVFDVVVLADEATLVWAAQLAAVEIHPYLAPAAALDRPATMVFDLDPGAPATLVECCRVARCLRDVLDGMGLRSWPKTSGGLGLHVVVPLHSDATYERTKAFARAAALLLERDRPGEVTSSMPLARRTGRVFVDWSQNDPGKSTVAAWSLRGFQVPTVALPVTWDEVDEVARTADARPLWSYAGDALRRLESGDPMVEAATLRQTLPSFDPSR
ncbi:MAG TPA: non-homologous end-joining DNA ligase [Acidimicrobiales bacterium]|nr:non-homologous end-joining DNA ligase [Acidimicrobiales bacterium]